MKLILTFFLLLSGAALHAQHVSVRGRITDSETGEGVPFVKVILLMDTSSSAFSIGTLSDDEGRYELRKIPPGTYHVLFDAMGMEKRFEKVVIAADSTHFLDVQLKMIVYELD